MKIVTKNTGWGGCFNAMGKCEKCGKTNIKVSMSWSSDKVSPGDTDKIKEKLTFRLGLDEHYYCIKCGNKLLEDDNGTNINMP